MNYAHDKLGLLYFEDGDWNAENVSVPFVEDSIGVSLRAGIGGGPSPAALSGYKWIEKNWKTVLSIVQDQAFQFYAPYADAFDGLPQFESPGELIGTERLCYLRVFSKEDFEVTVIFDWQVPGDEHEITFYVEGGECKTHCVDG